MIVCMQLPMLYFSAGHPSSGVTVGNEDAPGRWSAGGKRVCVCESMYVKTQREGNAKFQRGKDTQEKNI